MRTITFYPHPILMPSPCGGTEGMDRNADSVRPSGWNFLSVDTSKHTEEGRVALNVFMQLLKGNGDGHFLSKSASSVANCTWATLGAIVIAKLQTILCFRALHTCFRRRNTCFTSGNTCFSSGNIKFSFVSTKLQKNRYN